MNYLHAQKILVDRLKSRLPAGLPVLEAVDFKEVEDQASGKAQVFVLFVGDGVADTSGESVLLEQRYATVYVSPGIYPDFEKDGVVLTEITKAMSGYEPADAALGMFERVGSMVPKRFAAKKLTAYALMFGVPVQL